MTASDPSRDREIVECEIELAAREVRMAILQSIATVKTRRGWRKLHRRLRDYFREHSLADMPRLRRLLIALTESDG